MYYWGLFDAGLLVSIKPSYGPLSHVDFGHAFARDYQCHRVDVRVLDKWAAKNENPEWFSEYITKNDARPLKWYALKHQGDFIAFITSEMIPTQDQFGPDVEFDVKKCSVTGIEVKKSRNYNGREWDIV